MSERKRPNRVRNRDKAREHGRAYYQRQKELEGTTGRPAAWRRAAYMHNYGITVGDYEKMFRSQEGLCAVCFSPPRGNRKFLSVDHDHVTGIVRGLLCHLCNPAIGMLQDDPDILRRAAEYIDRSRR